MIYFGLGMQLVSFGFHEGDWRILNVFQEKDLRAIRCTNNDQEDAKTIDTDVLTELDYNGSY